MVRRENRHYYEHTDLKHWAVTRNTVTTEGKYPEKLKTHWTITESQRDGRDGGARKNWKHWNLLSDSTVELWSWD